MKILAAEPYQTPRDETVAQYAARCLGERDWDDGGAVEAAAREAQNCSKAIGNLLELMAEKGMLTAPDVTSIVDYYRRDDATFVKS